MSKSSIKYDEVSDTLTISFESGLPGTGIELTEHILLRINQLERKAISVFFLIILCLLKRQILELAVFLLQDYHIYQVISKKLS